MTSDFSKNFFVNSVVSDLFTIESQLCSTRTADLFKAFDRERGRPVAVWMLRNQFQPDSPDIRDFATRLGHIAALSGRIAKIMTAGVDPTGVVFAVISPLDGYPILGGNLDSIEAERRFIAAIRLVEQLHSNGIVCGDLSSNSFWLTRSGEINYVGIMGSYERVDKNAQVPPVESIHYLAPEQNPEKPATPLHDVYALGVLGYQLLTHTFPPKESSSKISLREIVPSAPPWIDEVIQRCLDPIPNRRYNSAAAMIAGIAETKEKIIKEQSAVAQKRDTSVAERVHRESGVVTFDTAEAGDPETGPAPGLSTKQLMVIGGITSFLMALLVVGGFIAFRQMQAPSAEPDIELQSHREAADDRLRKAIDTLQEDDEETKEKRVKFKELQDSDDPLAHEVLVRGAIDTKNNKIRMIAERSIIGRAKRLKLLLAAGTVEKWIELTNISAPPPEYVFSLKTLDPTLPLEGRKAAIRRVFELNPDLGLRIVAALTLDSENPDDYHDLVSDFIGAALKLSDTKAHASLALLIAHPGILNDFREPLTTRSRLIPDADIRWLLQNLLTQGSPNLYYLATLAVERRVYPPMQLVYLEPLRDRSELPEGIPAVLVRAASKQLSMGDLELLGTWFDEVAQRILFAICADDIEDALRTEAFEYLAGRGLSMQPAGEFVLWVKDNHWEQRLQFARPAGVLALADMMSEREIAIAFEPLKDYSKDDQLFDILFDSEVPAVSQVVIREFGNSVPVRGVIKLLANPSKEVRMTAVKTLKGTNDVSALKAIIALYEAEVDPDVKAAYREHLWVIKQRGDAQ